MPRRRKRKRPQVEDLQQDDLPGFEVKLSAGKGRGVFATEYFQPKDLLMVYHGELITGREGDRRENGPTDSVFRFFFKYNQGEWCVDATEEPRCGPKLGRLVNHGSVEEINAKVIVKTSNNLPVLCLQATKKIRPGDEILYDYGLEEDEMPFLNKPVAAHRQSLTDVQDGDLESDRKDEDVEEDEKGKGMDEKKGEDENEQNKRDGKDQARHSVKADSTKTIPDDSLSEQIFEVVGDEGAIEMEDVQDGDLESDRKDEDVEEDEKGKGMDEKKGEDENEQNKRDGKDQARHSVKADSTKTIPDDSLPEQIFEVVGDEGAIEMEEVQNEDLESGHEDEDVREDEKGKGMDEKNGEDENEQKKRDGKDQARHSVKADSTKTIPDDSLSEQIFEVVGDEGAIEMEDVQDGDLESDRKDEDVEEDEKGKGMDEKKGEDENEQNKRDGKDQARHSVKADSTKTIPDDSLPEQIFEVVGDEGAIEMEEVQNEDLESGHEDEDVREDEKGKGMDEKNGEDENEQKKRDGKDQARHSVKADSTKTIPDDSLPEQIFEVVGDEGAIEMEEVQNEDLESGHEDEDVREDEKGKGMDEKKGEDENDQNKRDGKNQARHSVKADSTKTIQHVKQEVENIEEVVEKEQDSDWDGNDEEESSSSSDGGSEYLPSEEEEEEVVPPSDASNDARPRYPHLSLAQGKGDKSHEVVDASQDEPQEAHLEESCESDDHDAANPRQSTITVKTTNNEGGRKYDKKHVCFYCEQPQAKLPRHLLSAHSEESAVVEWMTEKDAKLKNAKLTKLRNLGNHLKNCKVLEKGEGELIVRYRPPVNVDARDFVPCPTCYGYFAKKFIWKHTCPLESATSASEKKKTGERARNGTMLLPTPSSLQSELKELLSTLKGDNISRVIKSDELILMLAKKENLKLGHDSEQLNYTRTKLREIARLLIEVRIVTKDPNATLTSVINPAKYNSVVTALKNVAGFDSSTHKYKTPSLALKVGHTLKKCATILKGEGPISGNDFTVSQSTKFLELCDMKWTEDVAVHAHRTLTDKKRNNPKRLPLAEDIVRLTSYLKDTAEVQRKALKQELADISMNWKTLNEITLTQVMLFNRRRQGEMSKMTVKDFNSRSYPEAEDHISDALSDFEKELCSKFKRAEIIGKKGRTVPVLLTNEMEESMSLLLSKREAAGISASNQFMFPCGTSEGHIRGSDTIRKFSVACGANNPNYLRSTGLRKQVATVSQVLNLKDNELDILAKFLGHDVRVHREFYRLPDSTLQVAKITKLLLSLENGTTTKLAGRTLDEIDVGDDEEVQNEDWESGSEDEDEDVEEDEKGKGMDEKKGEDENDQNKRDGKNQARHSVKADSTKRRKYIRKPWSEEEIASVKRNFRRQISLNQLPGKAEIERVQDQNACLQARTWTNIKDFIRNHFGRGMKH